MGITLVLEGGGDGGGGGVAFPPAFEEESTPGARGLEVKGELAGLGGREMIGVHVVKCMLLLYVLS